MKVSFDYDNTLDRESVQRYAAELVKRGLDVWIVTSRYSVKEYARTHHVTMESAIKSNLDIFEVAHEVGIPEDKIVFLGYAQKHNYFKEHPDFIWHLDDDWQLNRKILIHTKVKAISAWGTPNWKGKCERILRKVVMT